MKCDRWQQSHLLLSIVEEVRNNLYVLRTFPETFRVLGPISIFELMLGCLVPAVVADAAAKVTSPTAAVPVEAT